MTEGIDKKIGYVVELNISRVLNTCINYTTYKNNYSIADKLKYIIEYNLINIDVDMIDNKEINTNNLIKKLMDIWKEDPVNHFKILLRKLDNEFIELDNETQKKLNKYFQNTQTNNKISSKILLKNSEDELQSLPKGNKKTPINSDNDSEDEDIKDDNTKEEQKDNEKFISFTHDILPDIIPLVCILTMDSSNMDFIEMINSIKNNPELLGIFDEQCNIWWKKTGLIEFIKEIISKFVNKESTCYNISIQIKMSIQSLIDKPAELLELINECLKPKDIEKKNYGEVFTPMPLINEMLDKLPEDVWSNKNMKWLDPASGMGNFPIAVYMRLMDGLKNEIVDEKLRKKHIIENMLYMCELNKKNVLVCKEIFDINNEYKLNIYNGDTLLFEPLNYFNIKKFDIIIGNPPYQEKDKSGDNKLYLEFTSKCLKILKKNRYLLFITPRTILEYLLLVGKNRTYIDYLYQINYLSIETSNRYFPNIGSTFVYFLLEKTECYKNTTIEYINSTNKEIEKIDKLLEKGFRIPRSLTATDLEILSKITSNTINYKLNDFIFDNKSQRIRKEHLNKNVITIRPTDTHNIKIIDTINKEHKFPGKYYYYNKKDSVYDKDKLVLSKKGYLMPYVDRTKDYTYSDNFKYIIDDNMDTIKMLLESPIIKYLLYQYSKNGFDSIDIIKNLTKKNLDNVNSENDLYIIYNITDNEIEHIQNITKTTINNRDRLKSNQDINDTISIKSTQSRTQYTVDILKNMCKERNIKGISKLSKKDLAIKLFDYHNNDNNKASSSYISLTDDEIKEIQILIDK
jgi:K+/H+ antiporter YhaU regulatory subunit KhtT